MTAFMSTMLALLSYYVTLLSTPTPRVSLLVAISSAPRLSAVYKLSKCILRVVLRQGTEVARLVQDGQDGSSSSTEGAIRLPDDDGNDDSETLLDDAAVAEAGEDEVRLIQQSGSKQHRKRIRSKEDFDTVTSWRIDHAISHSTKLKPQRQALSALGKGDSAEQGLQEVASEVARLKGLPAASPQTARLSAHLARLQTLQAVSSSLVARSQVAYDPSKASDASALRELWRLLQPASAGAPPSDLKSKAWQDLGFQGKDPSTDWRSVGMLGLDSMLHFAKSYEQAGRARAIVQSAVKGIREENPLGWYPFALASITITDFALRLLKIRGLTYFLLAQSTPSAGAEAVEAAFHRLVSLLLLHFHQHWVHLQTSDLSEEAERTRPVVMDFERVVRKWRIEVARWVERGQVQGWVDSRGLIGVVDIDPPCAAPLS